MTPGAGLTGHYLTSLRLSLQSVNDNHPAPWIGYKNQMKQLCRVPSTMPGTEVSIRSPFQHPPLPPLNSQSAWCSLPLLHLAISAMH